MLNVAGSMSTKTGRAPSRVTALAVAKKVKLGSSTSSPGPTSRAMSASSSASLPDAQATADGTWQYSANRCSSSSQSGPSTNRPDWHTRSMASRSAAASGPFWRLRSSSGTGVTSVAGVGTEIVDRTGSGDVVLMR